MQKRYIVRLTDAERRPLQDVIKKLKGSSQKLRRARILLKADVEGPAWTDRKIAEAVDCRKQTVESLRQRLVEQGFDSALNGMQREQPPTPKLLDGKQEAQVIAMRLFHDVKEVWGSGQQQVRTLWANVACWHLNLWLHTLVELWAWDRPTGDLVRRHDSPWDDAHRRPSHADRRKALQAACLATEFSRARPHAPLPRKIRTLLQRLLRIAI
jgi:hypothetical protein